MKVQIAQETCCNCNVMFWITARHQERLIKCKNTFFCPNGHPQSYKGETDREKLERAERNLASERACSERLVRSNSALRGVITKKQKALKTSDK